jgi:hypothetical protein
MPGGTAAGPGFGQVGCVAVHIQLHVAGMIVDRGQWVGRGVVHEPVTRISGLPGGFGLGRSNGAKRREHERFDAHGVI